MEDFDKLSTIAHAVSHLSTRNKDEARQYMSSQDEHAPRRLWTKGAELVGNRQPLGGALEEGMATLDQVDFFNTYLQINHPQEYARRRQAAESLDIQKQVQKLMSKRLYGEISPLAIAPFIVLESHHRRVRGTKIVPTLDVIGLKRYLFARKMCEVLGKSLAPDQILGQDGAIQLGRDEIDKDRYLRTQDAHRKIVEAMGGGAVVADRKVASEEIHGDHYGRIGQQMIGQGGKRARMIFTAKANDDTSIDKAMAMFRYVKPRSGSLVNPDQSSPRNLSREWAEAAPPAPIEPDQSYNEPPSASQGLTLQGQTGVEPAAAEVDPAPMVEVQAPVVESSAKVVEKMLPPIAVPPTENQPPTPGVGAREVAPLESDPNGVLRSQLAFATRELDDKLDRIRRIHEGEYVGVPEIEERLVDKYRADIERIEAEIAANIPPKQ